MVHSDSSAVAPASARAPHEQSPIRHHHEPGLAGHLSGFVAQERPPTAQEQASVLAEQNEAFGHAIAAAHRGDRHAALEAFSGFLSRYPTSQLRESALVEQLRLLVQLHPQRAQDAARHYLEAYPKGAARLEAQAVLEGNDP